MASKHDLHVMQQSSAWEAELNKERAGALGITARKLEALLNELKELGQRIDAAREGPLRELLLTDYRRVRDDSEKQRWNLCVQREAMGLHSHDELELHYPTAPRR